MTIVARGEHGKIFSPDGELEDPYATLELIKRVLTTEDWRVAKVKTITERVLAAAGLSDQRWLVLDTPATPPSF